MKKEGVEEEKEGRKILDKTNKSFFWLWRGRCWFPKIKT